MKFAPPKANYKRPKIATFIAFLQSKGWTLDKEWGGYLLLKPPAGMTPADEPNFRYYLPIAENVSSHDELAFHAVETFSDLYDIPLQELFDLLSQSIPDLRQEVERQPRQWKIKKEIVESAAAV